MQVQSSNQEYQEFNYGNIEIVSHKWQARKLKIIIIISITCYFNNFSPSVSYH